MNYIESFDRYELFQDSSAASGDDFFRHMGRFFADPAIRKELGGPMSDSERHVWLMARSMDTGEIVAFSGVRFSVDRRVAWFTETWVSPDHRNNGLFERLFTLKYDMCVAAGARTVYGMANPISAAMFERHGWQVASQRGQWSHYEKHVRVEQGQEE